MTKCKEKKVDLSGVTAASLKGQPKYVATHICVGIDVSMETLDVCISVIDANKRVKILATRKLKNSGNGFKALVSYLSKFTKMNLPLKFVMEATGTYHENCAQYLHQAGYAVCIVLPNKSKNFAKSLNKKSKTDKSDAQILAQFGLERDLKVWEPGNTNLLLIRDLCREKEDLLQERNRLKSQIHAIEHGYQPNREIIKRKQRMIKEIDKQLKEIATSMAKIVNSDQSIKADVERLCTIEGIGLQTAIQILGETNGFELISSKAQLVSYAGYDVVSNDSGTSVHGRTRMSKKGNSHIRKALFFPAMVAVKKEGEMQSLYKRVLERNPKQKMKGLVAVQRKLLVLMFTLCKTKSDYDPTYAQKKAAEQAEKTLSAA